MRKFKPLDLSFIAAAGSPERESFRNVANMINANAGWSTPSQQMLTELKKAQEEEAKAKNKPTFLSGFLDLLSTPIYGVANAFDEAIAGHQKDNNDSILEDAATVYGGLYTGLGRGLKAGLRGASSMLDSIPGVDISDDWQSNPEDKTRFGDVYTRLVTKMSSKEAQKPENWEKAKREIEKEKAEAEGIVGEDVASFFYPDMEAGTAREDFFQRMGLLGLAGDIGLDPTTYLTFGGSAAAKAGTEAAALTKGLEAARASQNPKSILEGLVVGTGKNTAKGDKFGTAPIKGEAVPEAVVGELPKAEAAAESLQPGIQGLFARNAPISPEFKGSLTTSLGKGSKHVADVSRYSLGKMEQRGIIQEIVKHAEAAKPGSLSWGYQAANILARHPQVEWTRTLSYLNMVSSIAQKTGKKVSGAMIARNLAKTIQEDTTAAKATRVAHAEQILNTVDPQNIIVRPLKAKLRPQQAAVASRVVQKFEKEILGKAKAPGTGIKLQNAIAQGRNARWSGPQQVRMWNQITTSLTKIPAAQRYDVATKILQHVEDYFLTRGAIPHSGAKIADSVEGLRLSQVAKAIGPKIMADNPNLVTRILLGDAKALDSLPVEVVQKIEALKASEAAASAPAVMQGISAGKEIAKNILGKNESAARIKSDMAQAIKAGQEAAIASGAGPVAAKVTEKYLDQILTGRSPIESVFSGSRFKTEEMLAKSAKLGSKYNVMDAEYLKRLTNAISKSASLPPVEQLGKLIGPAARMKDWLGARFNAAYGVTDMRPIFLQGQAAALTTVAQRSKYLSNLAKVFNPKDVDLWHEAFRAAQANGVTTGRISELQTEISKTMENLFGGTGLKAGALADSTVAGRARLTMDELNRNLRRFGLGEFKFSNGKKVKDALGNKHDLSKGADWLKSWELWDIKKPYEFLHRVQQAVEATVRERQMFEEIATRFGSQKKLGDVRYSIDHPYLNGFYFNEAAARQGEQFVKIFNEVTTPNPKSLQYIDHVISKVKAALTIYIPSHHWTNVIGDTVMNWFAGVNDPRRYSQAMKVMSSQKGRYGDIAQYQKGVAGPQAELQSIARSLVGPEAGLAISPAGNSVITTMRNGQKVTADMIYVAAMQRGILPSARVLEEVTSDVTSVLDKIGLPGKAHGAVRDRVHAISEFRDHLPRLAQFIDGIAKSGGNFQKAADASAAAVRKWHPDGLDLTKFERDVMKRVFPFYSWTRKAIPLMIQASAFTPGKVMAYPHLMEAISLSNGVQPQNETGYGRFPNDQMFPDWLRERGIGPVAGGPGSYLFVNPSTPALDIMTLLGHPGQSSLDMLNPLAKVPLELSQGATLGKQIPIDNQADYLAKQIPGVSHFGRVSGYYGTSDSVADSDRQRLLNLLNILTGAKATDSGIYQKSAQFDVRDYLKDRRNQ